MNYLKKHRHEIFIFFAYLFLPIIVYYNFFSSSYGIAAIADNASFYIPSIKLLVQKISNGDTLLWNEYILAGHPFLAESQTGAFYPGLILYLLLPFRLAFNYSILLHFSLAGWFTYLYLRGIRLSWVAAFLGGSVFMFCLNYHASAASIPILNTVTWFPLVMYFIEKRIASNQKKFLLFAALAFVIQLFAGFPQDSIYTALAVLIYSAIRYYGKPKPFQSFCYDMILFALIVISFSAIQLLPTQELNSFMNHSSSWQDIQAFSVNPLSFLTLFSPFIWGPAVIANPLVGPTTGYFLSIYMGTFTIIVALYALRFWKKNNIIIIWSTLFILTLIMAAGIYIMPVAKLLFALPIAHDLRVHSRMYFISSMAVVVLFAYGLDYVLRLNKDAREQEVKKILKLGFLLGMGILVFIVGIIAGVESFNEVSPQLKGLTANGVAISAEFEYYHFLNPYLFCVFLLFLVCSGILLLVKKWGPIFWCFFWLICLADVGFTSVQIIQCFHMPVRSFSSDTMVKLKSIIKPTERMWVIYPTIQDFVTDTPNMNLNASALYNMQGIDGYVSFTNRAIQSLPNHNITSLMRLSLSPYGGDYLDILQNHNDFISMLGVKYLIIDKKYSADVEKSYDKTSRDWQLVSQFNSHDVNIGKNHLGDVVLAQNKIAAKPKTYYKIKLDVEDGVNSFLYTKLNNGNYDHFAQYLIFVPEKSLRNHFSGIVNSGNDAPNNLYVTLVTTAKNLNIKNLSIYSSSSKSTSSIYNKIFEMDNNTVFLNPNAKDKVYSLNDVRWENNIDYVDIDLLKTAVIDQDSKELAGLGVAKIEKINYRSGKVNAQVNCSANHCFVIFSESYFPGWKAYIDGKKTNIFKVNDLIMGVFIDKGDHLVRFHYLPNSFIAGIVLFLLGLIWVPIWIIFPRFRNISPTKTKK